MRCTLSPSGNSGGATSNSPSGGPRSRWPWGCGSAACNWHFMRCMLPCVARSRRHHLPPPAQARMAPSLSSPTPWETIMDDFVVATIVATCLIFVLMAIGTPVFAALGLAGVVGIVMIEDLNFVLNRLKAFSYHQSASYQLTVVDRKSTRLNSSH